MWYSPDAVAPHHAARRAGRRAMSLRGQLVFWFGTLAICVLLLWLLSDILLPFIAGMGIAYLLNPIAVRIERAGMPRGVATLLIIVVFLVLLILLGLLIIPILSDQLSTLIASFPTYVTKLQALVSDQTREWVTRIFGEHSPDNRSMTQAVTAASASLTVFLNSLWTGGKALISLVSLVVITPVVAFYVLYDWEPMIRVIDGWIPVKQRETVRQLAREIDAAIAGFVRGQSGVCLIVGAYYAAGLTIAGLNSGLLIGLIAGVLTFIPYVGSLTGLLLATSVAVAQFWPDWWPIGIVAGIFVVGQALEGYVLAPRLVGRSVGLHPVWLMFALFSFGYLFGFAGAIIAIPLAAAIGVLARFGLRQYLASPFYTGQVP
jgi:predicted PurR-regulated permease PerM